MKGIWNLQDAKNKFSNLVKRAQKEGPQVVTKRGVEAVVILSIGDYRKLVKPKTGLVEFFRRSPLKDAGLDIKRSKEPSREVEL